MCMHRVLFARPQERNMLTRSRCILTFVYLSTGITGGLTTERATQPIRIELVTKRPRRNEALPWILAAQRFENSLDVGGGLKPV